MNRVIFATTIIFFVFPVNSWAVTCNNDREKIRAYIVDDNSGTRSGPIRCLTSQKIMNKLKADKDKLEEHSQGVFKESGFAKPGQKYWTSLPADNIFD